MTQKVSLREWSTWSAVLEMAAAATDTASRCQHLGGLSDHMTILMASRERSEVPITQTPLQQLALLLKRELDAGTVGAETESAV
jgi:N-acyl-D-aspartate/D-glutamate deacylase